MGSAHATSWLLLVGAFASPLHAADEAASETPETGPAARAAHTLAATPSGVDTYTAFVGERGLGAAGVGALSTGDTADVSGGVRIWGGFLERLAAQAEAAKNEKGRFAPSLALAVRLLGDRQRGLGLGLLGRYRTEGFSTIEGEIEGGVLGSYAKQGLHLDLGVVAGKGIDEDDADFEGALRFGHDLGKVFRLGLEGRYRHEFELEEEPKPSGAQEEWDAFVGPQLTAAYDHFFGMVTLGAQKRRTVESAGFFAHVVVGGVAF